MTDERLALRQVRLWQIVFLIAVGAGVATAASGAAVIGAALAISGLLGFFVLVALVGWHRAGKA